MQWSLGLKEAYYCIKEGIRYFDFIKEQEFPHFRDCLGLEKTGPLYLHDEPGISWEKFTTGRYSAYIGFSEWTMTNSLVGNNANYRDINYGKVAKDEEGRFHDIAILVLKDEVTFNDKIRFEST